VNCQFRHRGKRHTFAIGKVTEAQARAKFAQVEYLLLRLKQRLLELPPGIDIVEFVQFDGLPPARDTAPAPPRLTLAVFRDRYLDTHRDSLEERTIDTAELHFRHLTRILGAGFPIRELKPADLKGYVDRRSREQTAEGRRISPMAVRKEIVSLRTARNWGVEMGLVAGSYPNKGVRYPKADEKAPFQTRDQIKRKIATGVLKPEEVKEVRHSLDLQVHEIAALLAGEHALRRAQHAAEGPWHQPDHLDHGRLPAGACRERAAGRPQVIRKIFRDAGYTWRNAREAKSPPPDEARLAEVAEQIVALYGAWGEPREAASWRVKLGPPPAEPQASAFAPSRRSGDRGASLHLERIVTHSRPAAVTPLGSIRTVPGR
jgi:hypothetical protein